MRGFEDHHQEECVTQERVWALDLGLGLTWEIWTARAGLTAHVTCPLLTSIFLSCRMGRIILPRIIMIIRRDKKYLVQGLAHLFGYCPPVSGQSSRHLILFLH